MKMPGHVKIQISKQNAAFYLRAVIHLGFDTFAGKQNGEIDLAYL